MPMAGKGEDAPLDVAIIGGGVAGTYLAYRLTGRRPDWRIALFERSGRTGGRLLSLRVPGNNMVRAELGGMRYRTSQPLIAGLIETLQLETRPFPTVHDDNRFFLRGTRWRLGNPGEAANAFQLDGDEEGLSPGELLIAAFERVVPGASMLSDQGWVAIKRRQRFRGRLLHDWSMGDLLAAVLSEEGHRYVVDAFGYSTILADRNAADAIPWILIEARPESENRTLVDGMERLPRDLADRFAAAGGRVHMGHALLGFEHERGAESEAFHLRFDGGPDRTTRRIVLAVPRVALELLVDPLVADQELVTGRSTGVTYWEGACRAAGRRGGRPVAARGYAELTGYAGRDVPGFTGR